MNCIYLISYWMMMIILIVNNILTINVFKAQQKSQNSIRMSLFKLLFC
jgi:hypothetical protein